MATLLLGPDDKKLLVSSVDFDSYSVVLYRQGHDNRILKSPSVNIRDNFIPASKFNHPNIIDRTHTPVFVWSKTYQEVITEETERLGAGEKKAGTCRGVYCKSPNDLINFLDQHPIVLHDIVYYVDGSLKVICSHVNGLNR